MTTFKEDLLKDDNLEMLLLRREATHGQWEKQAMTAALLKTEIRRNTFSNLSFQQLEALDMIMTKIARILTGDPNCEDHWNDIAGYAILGKQK